MPPVFGQRFAVFIPSEFEALTVDFVHASLFLGDVQGYYERFWWRDAALHIGSGFLLGIPGFLLVYVLNERSDIELHMRPRFVALFAFVFAIGMGALWEIFEFGMDQIFGLNMQRSGLLDTMWDLIVRNIGALVNALPGCSYLRTAETNSFPEGWIATFIRENP